MEEDVGGPRPNIRVEIQNNLVNSMEVDEERQSEGEEGEISDSNELDDVNQDITFLARPNAKAKMVISDSGFSTGINIFDKVEQEKRSGRAKRFALDPKDINNFTEEHLQELHNSLDINSGNEDDVKFESLHIYGVEDMSTEDVLEYFGKYAPATIEWITEDNCNVVWTDKVSAARALFYLSKAIQGIAEENERSADEGRSVLLKSKNREVVIQAEKENGSDVHISQIADPLPPGYWRLGVPHHKSKCILMRFSIKSDATPVRAEKFVNYYNKKVRVPKKAMFKGIFDRNLAGAGIGSGGGEDEEDNKNPWGSLARNWYEDIKYAEQEYKQPMQEEVKLKNAALQNRLGYKRAAVVEEHEEEEVQEKKSKVPRMRMYADEEEEKIKRRLQLSALKKVVVEPKTDLRSILGITKKKPPLQPPTAVDEQIDLGAKLKNRKGRAPQQHSDVRGRLEERSSLKSRLYTRPKSPKRRGRASDRVSDYEEDYDDQKTGSKVAVVIKKQKAPAVASTVWSRINEKERLKTVSEGKLRVRRDSSSSATSTTSSSTFYSEDTNEESVDEPMATLEEDEEVAAPAAEEVGAPRKGIFERPGFKNSVSLKFKPGDHKSPLRIEINNDHFKRK